MPTDKNLLEWAAQVLAEAREAVADLLRTRAKLANTVSHVRMLRPPGAGPPSRTVVSAAPARRA
jgi:hypothetical protein